MRMIWPSIDLQPIHHIIAQPIMHHHPLDRVLNHPIRMPRQHLSQRLGLQAARILTVAIIEF